MRLVSWNVNGFRAVLGKGFSESFDALDADIFAIQETKMQEGQAEFYAILARSGMCGCGS